MPANFQISGKALGVLAMPDFCPRCFWIRHNLKGGLPYQVFPGIFSSIDSYVKKVVHKWFDENGAAPEWLPELSDAKQYLPALHHSKFRFVEPTSGVTLIDEALGSTVSRLFLSYCEPSTSVDDCTEDVYNDDGFELGFKVKTLPIARNSERVVELLIEARRLAELETPPERHCGCKECTKLDKLITLAA